MKKYIITALICITLSPAWISCESWLNVRPEASVPAEKMFETKQGFRDALTGLYLVMREVAYRPNGVLIGGGLQLRFLDLTSVLWTVPFMGTEYEQNYLEGLLRNHVLQNDAVSNMSHYAFKELYRVIANTNLIIDGLDKQTFLDDETYNIIRGETHAVRAFMHFDLLRLYGPIPTDVDAGRNYLPYVKIISPELYTYISYEDYVKELLTDLEIAETHLSQSDPILTGSNEEINTQGFGEWSYRQNRMNYYALLGLCARVHLWLQDKPTALSYAKKVIEATDPAGKPQFTLANSGYKAKEDYIFFSEHLFGVKIDNYEYTQKDDGYLLYSALVMPRATYRVLFPDTADIRSKLLRRTGTNMPQEDGYVPEKFNAFISSNTNPTKSVPMIRLAEMYLIVMECGDISESNEAYATLAEARNIQDMIPFTAGEDRTEKILREYTREFYAEGQIFYANKRQNIRRMMFSDHDMDNSNYVFPIPPKEYLK